MTKHEVLIKYTRTCPICNTKHSIMIPLDEVLEWESGELVAIALKSLTPTQHLQILTNACASCVDKVANTIANKERN